jgi:hypothetical protein
MTSPFILTTRLPLEPGDIGDNLDNLARSSILLELHPNEMVIGKGLDAAKGFDLRYSRKAGMLSLKGLPVFTI